MLLNPRILQNTVRLANNASAGSSYVLLNTLSQEAGLVHYVHFWLGKATSQARYRWPAHCLLCMSDLALNYTRVQQKARSPKPLEFVTPRRDRVQFSSRLDTRQVMHTKL